MGEGVLAVVSLVGELVEGVGEVLVTGKASADGVDGIVATLEITLSHTMGVFVGVVSTTVGLGPRLVSVTTGAASGPMFTSCGGRHGDEVKVILITAGSMIRVASPSPEGSSSRPGLVAPKTLSRHSKAAETSASCVAASTGAVPAISSTHRTAKVY